MESMALPVFTRAQLQPISVEQYHRMREARIFEDGAAVELLQGVLVRKLRGDRVAPTVISPAHAYVVQRLGELVPRLVDEGCFLRVQLPLTLEPDSEPEPDGAIVLGESHDDRYRHRHPTGSDTLAVIEVADSSLQRDRTEKLALYASAQIPQYIIVNLVDGLVEIYQEPKPDAQLYTRSVTVDRAGSFKLLTAGTLLHIEARDWLR